MRSKEFAFWTYLYGMAVTAATIVAVFFYHFITTWTWGHWHGPPTPHSLYFSAFWLCLLAVIYPVVLVVASIVWYEEAYDSWLVEYRKQRKIRADRREVAIENRDRVKDQAKLRKLALVAAENDVYDSIREGGKVSDTTAALLRQAELSNGK